MTREINLGNLIIPLIKPQKGIDYYTSAEKQEIVNEVTNNVNDVILPQEEIRQSNEITRQNNENTRQAQETSRTISENERQNAETERIEAESIRQDNESSRESAEQERTETFNTQMQAVNTAIQGIHTSQEAYDQNAQEKTTVFNTNATNKMNAYNTNATEKIAEYDAHVHDYEQELANKVDKVAGKGLSTNDFTDAYKLKVDGDYTKPTGGIPKTDLSSDVQISLGKADTAIQEHQDISGKEDVTNKVTSLSSSSTDAQYPSAKAVYDKFVGVETEIANIQSSRGHVYGIKRALSNNSSNAWERTDDAVGLVANATKNGGTVQNDFDNRAPWSEIKTLNYDITNKKILAYLGDPDFKFDGTNGDVYTQVPEFWYKIWQDETYEYIQIADYKKSGFIKSDKFMGARYTMGLVDNTLHSYSGLTPARNKTIGQFRTLARAIGNEFCLLDYRFFIIRLLYLVEYASYHSQSKLGSGMSSMRFSNDDVALIAESNTNRIIINTTGGNAFYVGQTISIGTSSRENFGVAEGRKITAINAYSDGTVTGKEIIFDGDPVNIATTNVIWSSGQHSGGCDSLGMKSGCLVSDNKHAVIYRGFENPFGNVWEWLDGYNIKDNQGWVCYNPADYVSDKFEAPYKQMGYANVNTNGWSKKLGLDVNNPLIRTPIEVGGGDSTYQCDYHYQNTGNRVALVGGSLSDGAYCGLWCLSFYGPSSNAYWNIGCRVLINQ